jgi:hypothetical protein
MLENFNHKGSEPGQRVWHSHWTAIACTLACAIAAQSAIAKTYQRGEFHFDVAAPPAWVSPHEVASNWSEKIPGTATAQWRSWLVDSQIDHRHGQRVRYFDRVIEPISSEMIREAGKIQIWFNPDYQELALHRIAIRRDGKWLDRLDSDAVTLARRESQFEQDMATGTVSALLVISDVRAGDLVRTTYSISGMNPIMAGLVNDELQFAGVDPMLERHARLLFDPGTKIGEYRDPGAPPSTQRSIPGALEWTASAHAVAPIIDEGSYPRWYSPLPQIVVGAQHDWAEIARWALSLYPPAKPLPADLRKRVDEWRALPDVDARIGAALRASQEEVRYFGIELGSNSHQPSEPAETWTRRYGDCKDKARLLVTMLGELGIEAHPALVSAESEKRVESLPPSASSFDHVIVQVRLADETLWLDPTQTQQRGPIRSLSPGNYGVALPIAADTRKLATITIPDDIVDRLKVSERFVPASNGEDVDYFIRTEYHGGAAQRMRSWLQTDGRETVARTYTEFYRRRYGELDVVDELKTRESEVDGGLALDEHYSLKKPWLSNTPGQRVLETLADGIASEVELPRTADRTSPYFIRYPVRVDHSTVFELPGGWTWDSSPVKRVIEDKGLSFTIDARQNGNELRIDRNYHALRSSLDAKGFADHFALLRQVNDLDGWRIVVSPPPQDAEKHRNQRLQNLMRGLLDERADQNSQRSRN